VIDVNVWPPVTGVGVDEAEVVPLPSWLSAFWPQHSAWPSTCSWQVAEDPATRSGVTRGADDAELTGTMTKVNVARRATMEQTGVTKGSHACLVWAPDFVFTPAISAG